MRYILLVLSVSTVLAGTASADAIRQTKGEFYDAFRQLDVDLPTPNAYRTASGAPGPQYWQQQVDYDIDVSLDEDARRIKGSETVTYTNNSPDTLPYLWVQLDQNRFRDDSISRLSETSRDTGEFPPPADMEGEDLLSYFALAREQTFADSDLGYELERVVDGRGKELKHTVVDTMMRIDLPEPLAPKQHTSFRVEWSFNLVKDARISARGGYEYFPKTDTYIYFVAQWFPRLAAYTDYLGWQNKAFLDVGEFTLEFGNYDVAITVPEDHVVSATGELTNASQVLTAEQRRRLDEARRSDDKPVFVVTPEEAAANEQEKSAGRKTWKFKAENVRDFAWASSRKFIWDAMIHRQDDRRQPEVLAMSFYPNEAAPLWSEYATPSIVHTLDVYSRFSFPYPYPTAQGVNTWKSGGMEYPMIIFNGYRPEPYEPEEGTQPVKDAPAKTYARDVKYGLIGVMIHEIGHIYFPMTVNSDERQWAWMDEGINSFLDYTADLQWEKDFPAYGDYDNVLDYITDYMTDENQVPIMTQADAVWQLGENAYAKVVAALTVLRETVMGRELFDYAFREYARRWKFKRPTPADFFRTMEDASGVDLDWFWRAWFYSTDHVDIAIRSVREYKVSTGNPDVEFGLAREQFHHDFPEPLQQSRNQADGRKTYVERHPELRDPYNENDRFTVTNRDRNDYQDFLDGLEDWERAALERAAKDDDFVYFVDFENIGGVPTPLPLRITYADGGAEDLRLPPEIWRRDSRNVTKVLIRDRAITAIELDPQHGTADADYSNNSFPQGIGKSRLSLYKSDEEDRDMIKDMLAPLHETGGEDEASEPVPLEPTRQ